MSGSRQRVPLYRNRRVLVPLYFFCGGLAGGLFAIAALAQLTAARGRAPVIRFGYGAALPLITFGSLLLLLDLTRPLRFARLLTHFNPTSPVSWGSFGLLAFGAAAAFAFVARWMALPLAAPIAAAGLVAALFIAAYTGVLLTASAKPAWNASPLLGGICLASALATAAAAIVLCARPGSAWLLRFLVLAAGLQALLLAAHLWCAARLPAHARGGVAKLFGGRTGSAFLASLALQFLGPLVIDASTEAACVLVLLGGIVFRYALFLAEE